MAKKTKRSQTKQPGLRRNLFSKIKQLEHDVDYIHKLSDEDKEFMDQFMTEYLGANLNSHDNPLHKSKAQRKSVFDRNNSRNRDIMSSATVTNRITYEIPERASDNYEEAFIDALDAKRERLKKLSDSGSDTNENG
jgi:hypothetical protein